jgi:hypothetical protein
MANTAVERLSDALENIAATMNDINTRLNQVERDVRLKKNAKEAFRKYGAIRKYDNEVTLTYNQFVDCMNEIARGLEG